MRQTAIVSGGSRGIGAAAARALAQQGFNVAISYLGAKEKAAEGEYSRILERQWEES